MWCARAVLRTNERTPVALELGSQTTAPPFEGVSFLSGGGLVWCARAVLRTNERTLLGSQLWAGARAAAANIRRQVGEGARGKRAAEGPADDAGARAQVRQRTGDGGSSSSDMIL